MNLTKREFIQVMGAGTMAGMSMGKFSEASAASAANGLYDIPKFGNVSFLHMTDSHAQLKPIYFREPTKCGKLPCMEPMPMLMLGSRK